MPFVIDASASVGWCIANQATDYSEAVIAALGIGCAFAPPLWRLEMVNALRTACRRKVLDSRGAQQFIATMEDLPINIDNTPQQSSELFSLALRHDLSAYDAAYLDLALRLQLPLATRDEALIEAAWAAGVGVWQPS